MSAEDQAGIPLPHPPSAVHSVNRPDDLRTARQLVVGVAAACGLGAQRCADLALATSEIVTNALQHGGGSATVFAYDGQGTVSVDVHDQAADEIPEVPSDSPSVRSLAGRGLWLARQLCDHIEIKRHRTGNIVRLVMKLWLRATCVGLMLAVRA